MVIRTGDAAHSGRARHAAGTRGAWRLGATRAASVVLAVASALAASAGPAGAQTSEAPLCRARVRLDPPRAFVGQPVVYTLRIERRHDVVSLEWDRNLAFPSFRSEWLPGSVDGASDDERYLAFDERRAIFPVREGVLPVPAASLRCATPRREESFEIPPTELPVLPWPEAGRPEGFAGLVGPVSLRAVLRRREIALGEAARLSLTLEGPANVFDWSPAPGTWLGPGVEVFVAEDDLARDAGRRLVLRRYLRLDLVPRRAGTLEIPALEVAWLDPRTGRYRTARSEPLALAVRGAAGPAPDAAPAAAAPDAPDGGAGPGALPWAGLAAAAALGWLWWRRRGHEAEVADPLPEALADALAAERAGDAGRLGDALGRALRAALRPALGDVSARSSEEIRQRAAPRREDDGDELHELLLLLQRLDRARFAPGDGDADALAELRAVRQDLARVLARRGAADAPPPAPSAAPRASGR